TTAVTAPAAAPGDSRPATGPVVTAVAGTEAPSRPPAPTTAPAPNPSTTVTTEGLLGTLGVDDLVETVGLPELAEAVEAVGTIVLAVTRDVVAPVLDVVVRALPVEVDPGLLPELPGVVLLPETTTAPTTSAPVADPEPNDAAPTPNDDDP